MSKPHKSWPTIQCILYILRISYREYLCSSIRQLPSPGQLLTLLLVASSLQEYLYYRIGQIPAKFYLIIPQRDHAGFYALVCTLVLLISGVGLISAISYWCTERYMLSIRIALSDRWIYHYASPKGYSLPERSNASLDNMDHRLCQDVVEFCSSLAPLLRIILFGPILIILYSHLCYRRLSWWGLLSIYFYFFLGTIILRWFMNRIVHIIQTKNALEGNFRKSNASACMLAESVKMAGAWSTWMQLVHTPDLHMVVAIQNQLIWTDTLVQCIKKVLAYTGSVLNYILIELAFHFQLIPFESELQAASLLSETSFYTLYLVSSLTDLLSISDQLAKVGGHAHRIAEMLLSQHQPQFTVWPTPQSIVQSTSQPIVQSTSKSIVQSTFWSIDLIGQNQDNLTDLVYQYRRGTENYIHLHNISIVTPAGKRLLENLCLVINDGVSVWISGPSGSGKSSIFRMLSKVWTPNMGKVVFGTRFVEEAGEKARIYSMFLPQEPIIFPNVDIIGQITQLPAANKELVELDRLDKILSIVGLEINLKIETMSPGQLQRLVLARLLYARPIFAFLDEATNSVEPLIEERIYEHLWSHGTTTISISHHSGYLSKHQSLLVRIFLDGSGSFTTISQGFPIMT